MQSMQNTQHVKVNIMTTIAKEMTVGDSKVSKELQTLNAKWRNYVAQVCGIHATDNVFQVAQGNLGLQSSDSSGLFLMGDTVPTDSPTGYYQSSSNRRSSAYNSLLFSMAPQDSSDLRTVLSDQYANWIAYRKSYYTDPKNTPFVSQVKLFEGWANGNLDPQVAQKAMTVYKEAQLSPLNKAIDAYNDSSNQQSFVASDGNTYSLYRYTGTIDEAKDAIANGNSISQFEFDSATATDKTEHTFTEGAAEGFYDIFAGEAGASFEQLNTKASSTRITVSGHIGKSAVLLTQPGAWYSSGIVGTAFKHPNDNTVWSSKASNDWDSFFSQPDGMLARYITSLLLVSDYELTVTIHAKFSKSEFQKVKTEAVVGVWPFFGAEIESTHTKTYKHNEDGTLTYTLSLNKGLIGIWGVNFREAP